MTKEFRKSLINALVQALVAAMAALGITSCLS
jgi:hypothetical protein